MDTTIFDTASWWDTQGPFKILHALAPLRMQWILCNLQVHHDGSEKHKSRLHDFSLLDLGCAAGLLCEPLARLGACVTGVDQSEQAIACAQQHKGDLNIHYICHDILNWTPSIAYDAIILMEVLEHVHNPYALFKKYQPWLKKGGVIIGSTLNRTVASHFFGIHVAEKILKWAPLGAHEWIYFLTPQELTLMAHQAHFSGVKIQGFGPKFSCFLTPPSWHFQESTKINYFFSIKQSDYA